MNPRTKLGIGSGQVLRIGVQNATARPDEREESEPGVDSNVARKNPAADADLLADSAGVVETAVRHMSRRRSCGVAPDAAGGGQVGHRHPSFGFIVARAAVSDTAFQSVSTQLCRRCPDRGVVGTPSATVATTLQCRQCPSTISRGCRAFTQPHAKNAPADSRYPSAMLNARYE